LSENNAPQKVGLGALNNPPHTHEKVVERKFHTAQSPRSRSMAQRRTRDSSRQTGQIRTHMLPSHGPPFVAPRTFVYFVCQMTVHLFSPDNPRAFRRRWRTTNPWTFLVCSQYFDVLFCAHESTCVYVFYCCPTDAQRPPNPYNGAHRGPSAVAVTPPLLSAHVMSPTRGQPGTMAPHP